MLVQWSSGKKTIPAGIKGGINTKLGLINARSTYTENEVFCIIERWSEFHMVLIARLCCTCTLYLFFLLKSGEFPNCHILFGFLLLLSLSFFCLYPRSIILLLFLLLKSCTI